MSSAVEKAFNNAGPLVFMNGCWQPDDRQDRIAPMLPTDIARRPDDFPIIWPDTITPPDHYVATESPEELQLAVREYLSIIGQDLPEDEITAHVTHEAEHAAITQARGARASRFLLGIWKNDERTLCEAQLIHVPLGLRATKLTHALSFAYPTVPSEQDIAAVRELGYRGIEEVALKAEQADLTVPLWYHHGGVDVTATPESEIPDDLIARALREIENSFKPPWQAD
jgi:hypothetical protein